MAEAVVPRLLDERLEVFRTTFRAVIVGGARQVGKTTLVRQHQRSANQPLISFDDDVVRRAAVDDPTGFVETLRDGTAIDEYQRAGEAFLLAVKRRLDTDNGRGQLILTGSASYLSVREPVETLAGRAGRLILWPFSVGEQLGIRSGFLDRLFTPAFWPPRSVVPESRADLMQRVLNGGYPEVTTLAMSRRQRRDWFASYVADVISREALRPIADVRLERELRLVLQMLAARSAQELIPTDLARDAGLARDTMSRYLALLEALYLLVPLPAWASSAVTRAKRRAKGHIVDTGLAASIAGMSDDDLAPTGAMGGPLLESFVVLELLKQTGWAERQIDLSHFRDRNGMEVDIIAEDRSTGEICGIEVKASASPTRADAKGLAYLRDRLGKRFVRGVVLNTGDTVLPFGDRIWAVPLPAVWQLTTS